MEPDVQMPEGRDIPAGDGRSAKVARAVGGDFAGVAVLDAAAVIVLGGVCIVAVGACLAVFAKAIAVAIDAFGAGAVAVHTAIVVVAVRSCGAAGPIAVSVVIDTFPIGWRITGSRGGFRARAGDEKKGR